MDKIIIVDINRCMGCHSCELACAVAHSRSKELVKALYEENPQAPKIILEQLDDKSFPIHCRHCEDAPCIVVCPSKAMSRHSKNDPSGNYPVVLDKDKCIGCHACIIVCPFGVIKKDRNGKSLIKCDLCFERLKAGENPACVEACPTGAIKFLTIEEAAKLKRKEAVQKYMVIIKDELEQ